MHASKQEQEQASKQASKQSGMRRQAAWPKGLKLQQACQAVRALSGKES